MIFKDLLQQFIIIIFLLIQKVWIILFWFSKIFSQSKLIHLLVNRVHLINFLFCLILISFWFEISFWSHIKNVLDVKSIDWFSICSCKEHTNSVQICYASKFFLFLCNLLNCLTFKIVPEKNFMVISTWNQKSVFKHHQILNWRSMSFKDSNLCVICHIPHNNCHVIGTRK